jgi:hypothetical protein
MEEFPPPHLLDQKAVVPLIPPSIPTVIMGTTPNVAVRDSPCLTVEDLPEPHKSTQPGIMARRQIMLERRWLIPQLTLVQLHLERALINPSLLDQLDCRPSFSISEMLG